MLTRIVHYIHDLQVSRYLRKLAANSHSIPDSRVGNLFMQKYDGGEKNYKSAETYLLILILRINHNILW